MPAITRDTDVNTADPATLARRLEEIFDADPGLRPRPDLHDYQLTYPPAIQLETDAFARTPDVEEYIEATCGKLRNVGYYFHFGFCAYRCRYCFHYEIKVKRGEDLMERYVNALLAEVRMMRELTPHLRQCLYFLGGGTPTALPLRLIERFLEGVEDTMGPPGTLLSTVEAKPVTATREKLEAFWRAGYRRINLGVQTLDPALYAHHHHGEDLRVALDAIDRARDVGFEQINIDIITGLERQTPDSWALTLAELRRLAEGGDVDSVFIYPYHDDPRSATFGQPGACPPFHEIAHSEAQARALFEGLGWNEFGARFWRSPRHIAREAVELQRLQVIPTYGETLYLGFGNSAFSVGDDSAYLNVRDARAYCERVEAGRLPISHWTTLDRHQKATRDLTFGLLYSPFTDLRNLRSKYGDDALEAHTLTLRRWEQLGLGRYDRIFGTWQLTRLGKLLHQQMLPQLYLEADRQRFDATMVRRREAGRTWRGY